MVKHKLPARVAFVLLIAADIHAVLEFTLMISRKPQGHVNAAFGVATALVLVFDAFLVWLTIVVGRRLRGRTTDMAS
jgi:hypothetical protein